MIIFTRLHGYIWSKDLCKLLPALKYQFLLQTHAMVIGGLDTIVLRPHKYLSTLITITNQHGLLSIIKINIVIDKLWLLGNDLINQFL